ncbi:hypothetical protein CYB_2868 [Synechococcus sp. JA-2-3B'a(2-13)]|nr:hypothetical protein CYB_2868 [Synechococcus sp. JA-2-3B'a(2-13)]
MISGLLAQTQPPPDPSFMAFMDLWKQRPWEKICRSMPLTPKTLNFAEFTEL